MKGDGDEKSESVSACDDAVFGKWIQPDFARRGKGVTNDYLSKKLYRKPIYSQKIFTSVT